MFPQLEKYTKSKHKNIKDRTVLHLDYDSFFASVEQQANPFLRNKPIGVTGSSLTKGVICAASIQAKKYGIKTGTPLFKARKICPGIIAVRGDGTKYTYIQKESLKIFNKYTDLVEAFSIDEAFMDVTKTQKHFGGAKNIAKEIKRKIKNKFGPVVTCSIGIGPNKLVSKLVSSMKKPDGVVEVTKKNMQQILQSVQLSNFCGIGFKIEARLNNLGIYTVKDLQKADAELLYRTFGNVESNFLKNLSYGIDYSPVLPITYKRRPKSIGHQHTLSKNTRNPQVIKNNLRRLSEMVGRRLRRKEMVGKTITVYLRDSNHQGYHQRHTIPMYTEDGKVIYDTAVKIINDMNWNNETRLVGITISNLIYKRNLPLYLLPLHQRKEKLIKASDVINDKFGEFTIYTADTMTADRTKGKISSFLKH